MNFHISKIFIQCRKFNESQVSDMLRACPREHRAVVLHAISPISMKLCQFKGSTPKLKKTNWFLFWFFRGVIRPCGFRIFDSSKYLTTLRSNISPCQKATTLILIPLYNLSIHLWKPSRNNWFSRYQTIDYDRVSLIFLSRSTWLHIKSVFDGTN